MVMHAPLVLEGSHSQAGLEMANTFVSIGEGIDKPTGIPSFNHWPLA